jgi:MFS family permease
MMAIGSVIGALLAARRSRPYYALLVMAAAFFGVGLCVAALMPNYMDYGLALLAVGVAAQTFTTSTNSYMQLTSEPDMRGRMVALFLAIAMGSTLVGAPVVGWVVETLGARWAIGLCGLICVAAAGIGLRFLLRHRRMA